MTYFSSRTRPIHRGVLSIEMLVILAVIAIMVITIFLNAGSLFGKNETSNELANVQDIMTNTRTLLKTQGVYDFSDSSAMMGALIEFGGVPKSMTVVGESTSGSATLINTWGGSVTLAPAASSGGKTGFTLTYEKVPQQACATLATKVSQAVAETAINGSSTVGTVSATTAGSQCTKDSGSTGTNTLKFTSLT